MEVEDDHPLAYLLKRDEGAATQPPPPPPPAALPAKRKREEDEGAPHSETMACRCVVRTSRPSSNKPTRREPAVTIIFVDRTPFKDAFRRLDALVREGKIVAPITRDTVWAWFFDPGPTVKELTDWGMTEDRDLLHRAQFGRQLIAQQKQALLRELRALEERYNFPEKV